jgi:hypothetical protein
MGRWICSNNDVPFERKFYFGNQSSEDIELFGGDQFRYHNNGCLLSNVRYEPSDISTIENRLSSLSSTIKEITGRDVIEWFTDGTPFNPNRDYEGGYGLTKEYWSSFDKCQKKLDDKSEEMEKLKNRLSKSMYELNPSMMLLDIVLHDHLKGTWDRNSKDGEPTKKVNMEIIPIDHLNDSPLKDSLSKRGTTSLGLADNDMMYCGMYLCMTYELGMEILNTIKKYSEFTLTYEL